MASNAPLTIPAGRIDTHIVRFDTAAARDGTTRLAFADGKTAMTDTDDITFDTPMVVTPGATFTAAAGAVLSTDLTVTGDTVMQEVTAGDVTATTKVVGNTFSSRTPEGSIDINASVIRLVADVEITGALDTLSSQQLSVRDTVIKLGAFDADEDGIEDLSDATRDGAGLVVPGTPVNLPDGVDPGLYEHSIKWTKKSGDFKPDGTEHAPHNKPMWELNGGSLSVSAVDHLDRMAQFFMAPHFTEQKASLGLYYSVGDGRAKLVHTFDADAFAAPP